MQLLDVIQKIRNDGWLLKDTKTKFKELHQTIDELKFPFVGRILTRQKYYAGRIEELKFNDSRLQFTITDCDSNGQSRESAKTYCQKVSFEDLIDIMTM
jgi:hypothetical protein